MNGEIDIERTRRILAQRLESLQRAGVLQIGKAPAVAAAGPVAQPVAPPIAARNDLPRSREPSQESRQEANMPRAKAKSPQDLGPSLKDNSYPAVIAESGAERRTALDAIDAQVKVCTLCQELACSRNKTVFGVGNILPRVAFFGEAPGADEDRTGEPFVGRAGQLLTKIIEACTFRREDVYILNVLKCRPPDNRVPLPDEIAHCRSYFERQFEILRPEYIVCAGTVAAQALLETTETIGKLRGRFHTYRGSKVVATYHPSYLLRNPDAKKHVWADMQMLLADMGIKLPGK